MFVDPLFAAVLGFVAGFVSSIPGGPVNATLIAEGPCVGFDGAFFLGALQR